MKLVRLVELRGQQRSPAPAAPPKRECWECDREALPDKNLCTICYVRAHT